MNELNERELADLARERAKIFSPQWFVKLFSARLGFGDTFWLGNYGVLLFIVPAVVLISGVLYAQSVGAMMGFLRAVALAMGLWRLGILQALVRIGPKGAWPIVGLLWTAGEALAAFITAGRL